MYDQYKWDKRYLELAEFVSNWSKDPSTKVGAVVVNQYNAPIGLGYNGFAPGVRDTEERLNNRDLKYKLVVHGEINAMNFAQRDLHGCTLYTWPFMPCSVCAAQIISRGIIRVVAPYSDNPRWKDSFELTRMEFLEARVELVEFKADDVPVITPKIEMPATEEEFKKVLEKLPPAENLPVLGDRPITSAMNPKDPIFGIDLRTPKDIM